VRIVNRTLEKAQGLAADIGGPCTAFALAAASEAFEGAAAVINATPAGLSGGASFEAPLESTPETAVVMDMVYQPLVTPLLAKARGLGRRTVDGLEMLVRQAAPSFEAFYGQAPPADVDVRGLALNALGG
jgi:shikimate dehydrogenase